MSGHSADLCVGGPIFNQCVNLRGRFFSRFTRKAEVETAEALTKYSKTLRTMTLYDCGISSVGLERVLAKDEVVGSNPISRSNLPLAPSGRQLDRQ